MGCYAFLQYFSKRIRGIFILKKHIKNKIVAEVLEWVICIAGAFVLYLFINRFIFQTADVYGASMNPTFNHGDKLIVNKLTYKFSEPQYGDIIIFPYRLNPSDKYIKRIVGISGDVIDFKNGSFYLNGVMINDEFSHNKGISGGNINFPVTVPEDSFFVLGDNRAHSEDSRYGEVGFINKKDIVGKVSLRVYPFNVFGKVGD